MSSLLALLEKRLQLLPVNPGVVIVSGGGGGGGYQKELNQALVLSE